MFESKSSNETRVNDVPFSFCQRSYPLNPSATVSFSLTEAQEVTLRIYDSFGRVIHTLCEDEMLNAGFHEMHLYGDIVPMGGCYARLHTKNGVQQRTLVRIADGY